MKTAGKCQRNAVVMLAFYKIMDFKAVLAYTLKLWKLIWSDLSRAECIDVKMTELDRIRD